jgi:GNAT superfamily N-acetyltransferase
VSVRAVTDADRPALAAFVRQRWGSERFAVRGGLFYPAQLPGFVAEGGTGLIGYAAYEVRGDACELMLLEAVGMGAGIGTALVQAVRDAARAAGCQFLLVVTTNDNVDALRFYQRRGFRLATLRPGAVDEARRTLKPEIPEVGDSGIPIRDELELVMDLTGGEEPPAGSSGMPDAGQTGMSWPLSSK